MVRKSDEEGIKSGFVCLCVEQCLEKEGHCFFLSPSFLSHFSSFFFWWLLTRLLYVFRLRQWFKACCVECVSFLSDLRFFFFLFPRPLVVVHRWSFLCSLPERRRKCLLIFDDAPLLTNVHAVCDARAKVLTYKAATIAASGKRPPSMRRFSPSPTARFPL